MRAAMRGNDFERIHGGGKVSEILIHLPPELGLSPQQKIRVLVDMLNVLNQRLDEYGLLQATLGQFKERTQ